MVKQNMKIAHQATTSSKVDKQRFQLWFFKTQNETLSIAK